MRCATTHDDSTWSNAWLVIAILALPIAIAIAILRHRLYDIDLVIRRSLIYTTLSTVPALIFFGTVTVLQMKLARFTGEQSTLTTMFSTLAIAALFSPLRSRIQKAIDRRFYRKGYNAQQALAEFARTARNEVSLETLNDEVLRVVEETVQPTRVDLWLRPPLQ